jgi:hypothetical protein
LQISGQFVLWRNHFNTSDFSRGADLSKQTLIIFTKYALKESFQPDQTDVVDAIHE